MNAKTLAEIADEMRRADKAWGRDNPDGTTEVLTPLATSFKTLVEAKSDSGVVTWSDILAEEVAEAISETDKRKLRAELIQVAAVALRWIRSLDKRHDPRRYLYLEKLTALELSTLARRCEKEADAGRGDAELQASVMREVEQRARGSRS